MKATTAAFVLLILSSFLFGASASAVNLFVSDYIGENETFTKIPFNLSDAQYYIINVKEPSLILRVPPNGSIAILTEKPVIRDALLGYYALQGITTDELKLNQSYVDELLSLVDSYNGTRAKEFECKTYIGIDRFPCFDLDSCWRACYTPICQQLKIGSGRPFLELLWSFSNQSSYIDSNISAFAGEVSSTSEFTSTGQVDHLVAMLDNMKNISITINNNDMFNPMALGFCHLVDYNLTYLTQAKINLLTKRDQILPLLTLDDASDALYNNTLQRISLKAKFKTDKLCAGLISNNSKEVSSLKANISNLNTSGMVNRLHELENAGKLEGCSKMDETHILAAELNYSNLSQEAIAYSGKLKEVIMLRNEANSTLAGMQGDFLLYFRLGEFTSRFSQLNAGIDSADLSQLSSLKTQFGEFKAELDSANSNKPVLFISSIVTSSLCLILVVLVLVIFFVIMFKKKKKLTR
ncbi:hypothetical protein H0N99_00805 [Candidatus Micrarchaeota archaeon]|nr:hypothetical protein [Candidatus Micrarchaeota archaeon]